MNACEDCGSPTLDLALCPACFESLAREPPPEWLVREAEVWARNFMVAMMERL